MLSGNTVLSGDTLAGNTVFSDNAVFPDGAVSSGNAVISGDFLGDAVVSGGPPAGTALRVAAVLPVEVGLAGHTALLA